MLIRQAAKCSQMTSPKTGSGSGGDRCTEATGAMICATYNLWPFGPMTTEQLMYKFTEQLNAGSDVSAPENFAWFTNWLTANGHIACVDYRNPDFNRIETALNRGHIGAAGFNNYSALRLADGSNPYLWTDPPGLGHVSLVVGYSDAGNPIVNDPLRADPGGQPAEYSMQSFFDAGFADFIEVMGDWLPLAAGVEPMLQLSDVSEFFQLAPDGQNWLCINGKLLGYGMLAYYRTLPFSATGLPRTNENEDVPTGKYATPITEQQFERIRLRYDPAHAIDNPPGAGDVYACHLDQWISSSPYAPSVPVTTPPGLKDALSAVLHEYQNDTSSLESIIGKL